MAFISRGNNGGFGDSLKEENVFAVLINSDSCGVNGLCVIHNSPPPPHPTKPHTLLPHH